MEVVFIVFIRLFILSAKLIDIAKFGSDFIPIYVRCVSPMTVTARCGEKNCSVYYWKANLIFLVWIYWAINLHFVKRMRGNIREMSSSKPNLHRSGRGIFFFSFSCSFHVSFLWIINLSSHITLSRVFLHRALYYCSEIETTIKWMSGISRNMTSKNTNKWTNIDWYQNFISILCFSYCCPFFVLFYPMVFFTIMPNSLAVDFRNFFRS